MGKYVWATIGTKPQEMDEAKAVVVHAASRDEAMAKVAEYLVSIIEKYGDETDEDVRASFLSEYGSTWFVQELSDQEIGNQ